MIRRLEKEDFDIVIKIVNDNWKSVYSGYVAPGLLDDAGCTQRALELKSDFCTNRFMEYVWEQDGQVLALLSIGNTEDSDRPSAFEVWRIYIAPSAQGKGLGRQLIAFAEQKAMQRGYSEVLIWAFCGNVRAIKFYQKCGYKMDKKKYLGSPYDTYGVRLRKRI